MTVKNRHTTEQLLTLAKTEKDKCLTVRIQAIALAKQGFACPIEKSTGSFIWPAIANTFRIPLESISSVLSASIFFIWSSRRTC